MGKLTVKTGSTSRLEHVFILDSTSTTGAGKTGLTNASVTMYFFRPADLTATSVTLSAGTLGTWTTGGFKEVDATNMPGVYEIGMPNAVFAATFNHSVVMIKGTGIAPLLLEYNLVSYDPLDAVRLGLTALPNVNSGVAGAIITSGTGTAQLSVTSGLVTAGSISSGAITTATFAAGAINAAAIAADALTSAKFQDGALIIGATTGTGVKISHGVNSITADAIANSAITIRMSGDGTASEGRIVAGSIASDVWNALVASYTTVDTFGARLPRVTTGSVSNQCILNASNHIAANIHQVQAGAITASGFAADAIDSNALAANAVTEIAVATLSTDISSYVSPTAGYACYQGLIEASNAKFFSESMTFPAYQQSMADYLLGRNIAGGSSTGRLVKEALYALRNRSEIVGSTLNVFDATDSAIAWTAAVSSSGSAVPVTGIDPV